MRNPFRSSEIRIDIHLFDLVVVVSVRVGEHPVSSVEQLLVLLQDVSVTQHGSEVLKS